MSKPKIHAIWNPATGIEDIPHDWATLALQDMSNLAVKWRATQERLVQNGRLEPFMSRLKREWAIETGSIEGLYTLDRGVTQSLIEHGFRAELISHGSHDTPRHIILSLLQDQQEALEGVFSFVRSQRRLSTSFIRQLHALLVNSQDATEGRDAQGRIAMVALIKGDWKRQPNFPVRDGIVYAYCPPERTASEMDRLVALYDLQTGVPPDIQAAWLHHRFTQIHPFQDGNGRVARAIGSLVLVKAGLFPFLVTPNERNEYLDALEAADAGSLADLAALVRKMQQRQYAPAVAAG